MAKAKVSFESELLTKVHGFPFPIITAHVRHRPHSNGEFRSLSVYMYVGRSVRIIKAANLGPLSSSTHHAAEHCATPNVAAMLMHYKRAVSHHHGDRLVYPLY